MEDQGIIRCICGVTEDDGFTIQCEKCFVWQHIACFEIIHDELPDVYYCEQCDPRPVDAERAKEYQTKRLGEELEEESKTKRSSIAGKKRPREASIQSPGRKKVKEGLNYPPLADGNDLVRKRGRPRLSAPIPVLSLTRQDLPNPIVRKKKGDHKNRKIRFSNSYVTEYYCNFFDFTVISENKFTGAVIDTINTLIKESHPLVSHKKDFEDIKQIEALLRSTDCVSLTESQYDSKSFSAQQSNKKNPVCEVEQRALYSTTSLFPGDIISEISGLLCSSNDLDISDRRHTYCPISVSKIDGCDSSHLLPPFVFHVLSTDHTVASSLFLDCRDISSSDGRFVQFACRKDIACANAILRAVVVIPDSENEVSNAPDLNAQFGISTMGVMRFKVCIFALKSIKAGDEIIIEGNERYMNYPCPIIRSHDCRLDRAVSILENYEHSHIGDPDIPTSPINSLLLQREKERFNAIHDANQVQDTQTMNLWTVGGEIDWDYQISVGTVSENTDDESDELDKFSVISKSEILDVELFSDDEPASKMEVDEEKVPEAAFALLARSETIEPRRVSLKDFMRQNSSLATDLPDSVPEVDSDISQAIEQTSKVLQIGTEVEDNAPVQPENSSSGGISEHEEGSIKNANGDSIEISESNDHDFFQDPSSASTRPMPLNYRPPYVIPPAPMDPSQPQRRDPDAGYGWERHDASYYRSQESFPPPKRPQSADRLYMERREYANSQIDLRHERARIIPHNRPPPRTAYRPEPPWQDNSYRPAPRDYRGEGPRFDSPREYWNEPGQAPSYSRDPWRDRYPPPDYRETFPSRRMNPIPYDYRQDRFRPPLAGEGYRPPLRDIEREREFQYRDQRERDARIYRPYPGKPRPDYGRPRQ